MKDEIAKCPICGERGMAKFLPHHLAKNHPIEEVEKEVIRPKLKGNALTCLLCGKDVAKGKLLEHKEMEHGEKRITQGHSSNSSKNKWVHVFQGGLPSLGKGSS